MLRRTLVDHDMEDSLMGSLDETVYLVEDHTDTPEDSVWRGTYWVHAYRKSEDAPARLTITGPRIAQE